MLKLFVKLARWQLVVVMLAAIGACTAGPTAGGDPTIGSAKLAVVVPDDKDCVGGVGRNKCVRVQPLDPIAGSARIDGVADVNEYRLPLDVPYANMNTRGSGRMWFTTDAAIKRMRLFVKNFPVPVGASKVAIFLDGNRFEPNAPYVAAGDVGFEYDVDSGAKVTLVPSTPSGSVSTVKWMAGSGPSWSASHSAFRYASDGSGRRSVDLEFQLTVADLIDRDRPSLGILLANGPGFEVGVAPVVGVFPEDVLMQNTNDWWDQVSTPTVRRANFQTLLFAPPPGQAVTFMTWNVKRFTNLMKGLETIASPFLPPSKRPLDTSGVTPEQIGAYIGGYGADVVALQEVWVAAEAPRIQEAANQVRRAAGKPEYNLVKGPDHIPSVLFELPADPALRPDESQSGLFILTTRKVRASGTLVYDSCKGDDCFKAKGALWARISTDEETPANLSCWANESPGSNCPPHPSGDHYVDVFTTHMNNDEPYACTVPEVYAALSLAYSGIGGPFFAGLVGILGMHCTNDADTVKKEQLDQLNQFIDSVTGDARDRPTVILGDTNVDGSDLSSTMYNEQIRRLHIAPSVANGAFPVPDDMLNAWPGDIVSDLDHGDVARDTPSDWSPGAEGTDIGASSPVGTKRIDYILVRNPVDRASLVHANVNHIMRKRPVSVPLEYVWTSPWPGPSNRSTRLSDHKPVLSSLEMAPYYQPGVYHPTWEHDLEVRVKSYDTTGIDDCWGCDQLDIYGKMRAERANPGYYTFQTFQTAECVDRWSSSFPLSSCMFGWYWTDHRATTMTHHRTHLELWDRDESSSDDLMNPMPPYDPLFDLDWARGAVDVSDYNFNHPTLYNWLKFWDSAPIGGCTQTDRANFCLLFTLHEFSPYP